MSSYAFSVQTCLEEHKKKHPDAQSTSQEFSQKYAEWWRTMFAQEKGTFIDMAKADEARHEEIKMDIPPKEETKKFKYPNAPRRPPLPFSWLCSEYRPKIKGEHPGLFTGEAAKKLREMWTNTAAADKQPREKKTDQLEEK